MKPVSFYLVTDTHYFEPSLGAEGKAFDDYMRSELYFVKESSAIVKAVFDRIAEDKETDIVIIPGDLTKNGEKESHRSFVRELRRLKDSGKKVFVITAGHDYNDSPCAYRGDERAPVEGTKFEELHDIYYEFGLADALAVDEATNSYMAEISPGVRMLALCCDSPANDRGRIDERLTGWAQAQLDDARAANAFVFAICHYPIIPPAPVFDLVGDAKVRDWRTVASFLADNGVELAFTGHMHIQSINEFRSEKGNRLIDVCTSTLVGSPAKYRKITVGEHGELSIRSLDVPDFGWDTGGLTGKEYFDKRGRDGILGKVDRALSGGKGFAKFGKKAGKKIFHSVKLGTVARLLWIRIDKSLKKQRLYDVAGDVGLAIFEGDRPYVPGTPLYDALAKALRRLGFILHKVEPKLSKGGRQVDLTDMLLNTVGSNNPYSDQDADFELKH